MQTYTVLIDFYGTSLYEIKAESHEDAYEKAKANHENRRQISRDDVYEESYYVESEDGIQEEF